MKLVELTESYRSAVEAALFASWQQDIMAGSEESIDDLDEDDYDLFMSTVDEVMTFARKNKIADINVAINAYTDSIAKPFKPTLQ